MPYSQEGYVHYVVDAVFALVTAIQRLIEEKCFTLNFDGVVSAILDR